MRYSGTDSPILSNNDTFRSELNGASVKGKGPEDKFMDIYYTAANNIANNKYQF